MIQLRIMDMMLEKTGRIINISMVKNRFKLKITMITPIMAILKAIRFTRYGGC